MKKKGFTLIELLAVIVILAIILIIILPSMKGIINKNDDTHIKFAKQNITNAAKEFINNYDKTILKNLVSEGDKGCILLSSLLDNNLITKDDYDLLSDYNAVEIELNANDKLVYTVSSVTTCTNTPHNPVDPDDPEPVVPDELVIVIADPVSFATDSWETIAANTNSSVYHVGDTKCVTLSGFTTTNNHTANGCSSGQFLVRIANKSTPSECSNSGFSQTG